MKSCSKVFGSIFEANFQHDIYKVFYDHNAKFHISMVFYFSHKGDHLKSVRFEQKKVPRGQYLVVISIYETQWLEILITYNAYHSNDAHLYKSGLNAEIPSAA